MPPSKKLEPSKTKKPEPSKTKKPEPSKAKKPEPSKVKKPETSKTKKPGVALQGLDHFCTQGLSNLKLRIMIDHLKTHLSERALDKADRLLPHIERVMISVCCVGAADDSAEDTSSVRRIRRSVKVSTNNGVDSERALVARLERLAGNPPLCSDVIIRSRNRGLVFSCFYFCVIFLSCFHLICYIRCEHNKHVLSDLLGMQLLRSKNVSGRHHHRHRHRQHHHHHRRRQPTNQPTNQLTNQPTNQPTN